MRRRHAAALLLVLLASATALPQDKPPPATKADWERVLEAVRAKDDAAVAAAVAASKQDPWLVADALCERTEFDAAAAFARAVKRKDCAKLSAYVTAQKASPADPRVRKAYAAADAALSKRDAAAALAACTSVERAADVPSLRLAEAHAFALRAAQRHEQALSILGDAEEAAVKLGWLRQAWVFASEQVVVHTRMGSPEIAAIASKLAVAAAEKLDDKAALAGACMDAGNAHLAANMLDQALALEKRALALHTELGDRGKAAGDQINIGTILMRGGRTDDALAALEQGLAAAKAAGERTFAATATGAIGLIWLLRKDYEKAAKWISDARKAKEDLGDVRGAAGESMNLANVRREQKRWDEARAAMEVSLATFERLGWKGDAMTALRSLARVAMEQKKPADAVGYLTRAMAIVEPTKVVNAIVPVRIQLAEAQEAAGDRKSAEANFRECAAWVEALGDEDDVKAVKDGFARLGLAWGEAGATAPRRGGDEDPRTLAAAATSEARKRWAAAQAALSKGDKAHAMGDLRAAAEALASPAYEQSAARKELDGVFREGVRLGAEVNDASIVYEFLARRRGCATTAWAYANAKSHGPGLGNANLLARMQGQLAGGTACVTYGVFDDETYAVVADRSSARVVRLGPTKAVVAAVAALALDDAAKDPEPALAALRALVAAPLAVGAAVRALVVAAPDEPLAPVPAALLFPDRDVAHLVSPEALWAAGPPAVPGTSAVVLGSDAEAQAWGGRRIDPAAATWVSVLSALPQDGSCRLVVLTAKVRPDPDDAAYRAFDFPAVPGKHVVDGARIGGSPFRAHLVVLTGGDAARTVIVPGEGPWGLPETFLGAGARGVVASRWQPDAAATRAFVDRLASAYGPGTTMAAAVRAAQAAVRAQPQWKHPRFWAGWVLVGLPE